MFERFHQSWLRNDLRFHLILLLALSAGLLIPTYGLWGLWGTGEGRYVQIAKELLTNDNWFLLTKQGIPYDQKPPLAFWMFAIMIKLSGGEISSWAVRLPSVLFAIMMVLLTYGIARRQFGPRTGLISALILLTSPIILVFATEARLDMMFAGWIIVSLFPWLTRPDGSTLSASRSLLMWGALAGAFFTKGPLAILVVLSVLFTEAGMSRSWKKIIFQSRLVVGLLGVFILIAGWLLIERQFLGEEFMAGQVKGETLHRLLRGFHEKPFWYYFPKFFTQIMFPWAFLLIPAGIGIWKNRRGLSPAVIQLLGWFLPTFLLLCIANGKRPAYVLPLIPPLAILVGRQINLWTQKEIPHPHLVKLMKVIAGALSIGMIAGALALFIYQDIAWQKEFYVLPHHMFCFFIAGIVIFMLARFFLRPPRSSIQLFYLVIAICLTNSMLKFTVFKPARDLKRTTRHFTEKLIEEFPSLKNGGILGAFKKASKCEYHVYGKYQVIRLDKKNLPQNIDHLPSLLIGYKENMKKIADTLASAGFRKVYWDTSVGDNLLVFSRDARDTAQIDAAPLCFLLLGDPLTKNRHQASAIHSQTDLTAVFQVGDQDLGDGYIQNTKDFPCPNMNDRRYYTVSYKNDEVTFFILDSETLADDPRQLQWLSSKLAACDSRWKILLLHKSFYSSKSRTWSEERAYRKIIPKITGKKGADIVFSRLNSVYERSAPHLGIQFITMGVEGKLDCDPQIKNSDYLAENKNIGAFVIIELSGDDLSLRAINKDGVVIDSATLHKERGKK